MKAQVLIVFVLFATISAVAAKSNWKQCVWRRQDYTDNGLIQVDCYSSYS